MAFLRAHVIFIGLLAYVVAVLNAADGDHHSPVRHTYRITSAPNVHRHTRKVPGQRIKHVRRHERTNPDIIELSEFGDNYGASYNSDSSNQDSGDYGSIPSIPEPTSEPATPAPATPAAETPAPETPAPATPAPATPAPETPAPETPAPATPAPVTPAPGDSSYSSDSSYAEEDYSLLTGSSNSSEYISSESSFSSGDYSYSSGSSYPATPASGDDSSYSYGSSYTENSSGGIHPSDAGLIPPTPPKATPAPETPAPATPAPEKSSEEKSTDGSCPLPAPVEGFLASLYTAYVVTVDPKILDQELSGGEVALLLYKIVKEYLEGKGVCNAEMIAFSAARGPANVKKITLRDFLKTAWVAIGNTLYNNGVMSCNNDVSLALKQFRNQKEALKGRDPSTFENNLYSYVKGTIDLQQQLGLDLGVIGQQVADTFSQHYVAVGGDECKAKAG